MESSSSYETFSTKLPDSKRKRTREREGIPASLLTTTEARLSTRRRSSVQEESMMEDTISPKSPFNPAVQRGSSDDVGTLSSYIGAITGAQTDPHIAINNLGATQAFGNLISPLYPNQSTKTSTLNVHGVNPPTPRSDVIGTVDRENQSQYRIGLEWTDFNACGRGTNHDLWDNLTSVQNIEQYHWDGANTHGDVEKWNDWSSFHAPFDSFNNALASNV